MFKIICLLAVVSVVIAHEKHFGFDYKIKHDAHYGGHSDGGYKHEEISSKHEDKSEKSHDHHYDHHDHKDYHHEPKYSFDYGVHDSHTGDNKKAWESRHGDTVKGGYMLYEPDGTKRVVEYTADKHHGFNAIVKKIGHAEHPAIYGKHSHESEGHSHGQSHGHDHGHATSHNNFYLH